MKNLFKTFVLGLMLAGVAAHADEASTLVNPFDEKHKTCLEDIAIDADLAYENAMIWQGDGGGRRARHCVAMALFALGHIEEAAFRLEKLAKAPDGGSPAMRAAYYAESGDLWLQAGNPHQSYQVVSDGLKIARSNVALRIIRARAYSAFGRWDYAEIDLSSALAFENDNPNALRYRADARLRQDKLLLAKSDIERAVKLDPENIDALVVRGKIIEAIRVKNQNPK